MSIGNCKYTMTSFIIAVMNNKLKDFLLEKLWEEEQSRKRRLSINSWARELGVPEPNLRRWMNGTAMSYESVVNLAGKLGDGIYEAAGYPRPDELVARVQHIAPLLKEKDREALLAMVAGFEKELVIDGLIQVE